MTPPSGSEPAKQVVAIMRPRARLGVVLHAERRVGLAGDSFDGLVVEVDMRHFHVAGQRFGLEGEAVVLAVISTLPLVLSRTGWFAPRWPNFSL